MKDLTQETMKEFKRIFATTNRTACDVERAVANGSFAVEAREYDSYIVKDGWDGYPSLEEIREDKALADEYDLELTAYEGVEYVLFIMH